MTAPPSCQMLRSLFAFIALFKPDNQQSKYLESPASFIESALRQGNTRRMYTYTSHFTPNRPHCQAGIQFFFWKSSFGLPPAYQLGSDDLACSHVRDQTLQCVDESQYWFRLNE